jgi:hypothetical protein
MPKRGDAFKAFDRGVNGRAVIGAMDMGGSWIPAIRPHGLPQLQKLAEFAAGAVAGTL